MISWKGTLAGCTSNVDFRPAGEGQKKYFLCFTAYTVPTRRPAGKGRRCKWLIFGGPCRGRTYGPLIKSPAEAPPQDTQQEESPAKREDS